LRNNELSSRDIVTDFDLLLMRILFAFLISLVCVCSRGQDTTYYDDFNGLPSNQVGGAVEDKNHFMWFATWNGLCRYDGYEFQTFTISPGDGSAIKTNQIRDILLSDEGDILCRTDAGIFIFDLDTYTFLDIPEEQQKVLGQKMGKTWQGMTDSQGNRWSFDGKHLCKRVTQHHPAQQISETMGYTARALFYDKQHRLWIGTKEDKTVRVYEDGRLSMSVVLDASPYCIYETSDGGIWIGCKPKMLYRCTVANGTITTEEVCRETVYKMQEEGEGRLWLACFDGGVKCLQGSNSEHPVLTESFGGTKVHDILLTKNGFLLCATSEGLLYGRVDRDDITKTRFGLIQRDGKEPKSLISNSLIALAENSQGEIYIATGASGIDMTTEEQLLASYQDASFQFKHFTTGNSSLTTDVCRAMALANDSTLFVMSGNSAMFFAPKSNDITVFGPTFWGDSCRMSEATPLPLSDGSWVFGTEVGAYIATNKIMFSRGYIPPIVFTQITAGDDMTDYVVACRDTLNIAPANRNLTLTFAAIDYNDNHGILYRTRLQREGWFGDDDAVWSHATANRTVTLFGIAPGTYRLSVQSTDRYGRWVDNMQYITIVIEPYWYETFWAKFLLLLMIVGATVAVICTYLYIKRVERQRREMLEKYLALLASPPAKSEETVEQSSPKKISKAPKENSSKRSIDEIKGDDKMFLERVRRFIEANIDNSSASIDEMASAAAVSRSTLNRRLHSLIGVTAVQLLIDARMQRAHQLLTEDETLSVTEIAYKCGFSDVHYFSRSFKQRYGVPPSELR